MIDSSNFLINYFSFGVVQARNDAERLEELGIESPDLSKQHRLKIDRNTTMFFTTKKKRDAFVSKYYNPKTKKYHLERQIVGQQAQTTTNQQELKEPDRV